MLGKVFWTDALAVARAGSRWRARRAPARARAARSSSGASVAPPSPARGSTCSPRSRPRRRVRPDPARRARRQAPPGRRLDRDARPTGRGPRGDAGPPSPALSAIADGGLSGSTTRSSCRARRALGSGRSRLGSERSPPRATSTSPPPRARPERAGTRSFLLASASAQPVRRRWDGRARRGDRRASRGRQPRVGSHGDGLAGARSLEGGRPRHDAARDRAVDARRTGAVVTRRPRVSGSSLAVADGTPGDRGRSRSAQVARARRGGRARRASRLATDTRGVAPGRPGRRWRLRRLSDAARSGLAAGAARAAAALHERRLDDGAGRRLGEAAALHVGASGGRPAGLETSFSGSGPSTFSTASRGHVGRGQAKHDRSSAPASEPGEPLHGADLQSPAADRVPAATPRLRWRARRARGARLQRTRRPSTP